MVEVKCIKKFRDKQNKIIGYRLKDNNGLIKDFSADAVKQYISNETLYVTNLSLTSDGRLIDSKEQVTKEPVKVNKIKNDTTQDNLDAEIMKILNKATILGFSIKEIDSYKGGNTYLLSKDNTEHIWLIPSNVEEIVEIEEIPTWKFKSPVSDIEGNLKVVGGSGLVSAYKLFNGCKVKVLDISRLDTCNVRNMKYLFADCSAEQLDISNLKTSKVEDMSEMFAECKAKVLDFSNFDTSNVTNMHGMFYGCKLQHINLSKFNTSKVKYVDNMFNCCETEKIDMSNFDTSNVIDMSHMFYNCKVKELDLSSFNTSKVENMSHLFGMCKALNIVLRSLDTSNVENMEHMFANCAVKCLDLRNFDTSKVTDMTSMFESCKAEKIYFGNFDTSKAKNRRYLFYGCNADININAKFLRMLI